MTDIRLKSFDELKQELESDEFYCEVGVASSVATLAKRLENRVTTQELKRLLIENPDGAGAVVEYASAIAHCVAGNVRSENDAALCACVIALSGTGLPRVEELFNFLRTTPETGLWWPSKLVGYLAERRPSTIIDPATQERRGVVRGDTEVVYNRARVAA
jgi:hypothetical protein